jgi:hypothetical protein
VHNHLKLEVTFRFLAALLYAVTCDLALSTRHTMQKGTNVLVSCHSASPF